MRYWTATILGIGLFFVCVAVFSIELTKLLDTGTCASGNQPFVVANECPEGTESNALLLIGSIFGLFLSGGIVAARGAGPSGRWSGVPIFWGWAIFFSAVGATSLIHSLTSEAIAEDGKLGGLIVGVIFLLMGLPVLAFVLIRLPGKLRRRDEGPSYSRLPDVASRLIGSMTSTPSAPQPGPPASGFQTRPSPSADATLDQLERLQRLRDAGTITEVEFATQKAQILDT